MSALLQDFRLAVRSLVRRPGFTLVVILTIEVGIGSSATVFTIVSGVLLKPLPFA